MLPINFQMSMYHCKTFSKESISWKGVLHLTHYLLLSQCPTAHLNYTIRLQFQQTVVGICSTITWTALVMDYMALCYQPQKGWGEIHQR